MKKQIKMNLQLDWLKLTHRKTMVNGKTVKFNTKRNLT